MYKIKIYSIGKTKESWLQEVLAEYTTRLKTTLLIEWILLKTTEQLELALRQQDHFLCLDPEGTQYTSPEFSSSLIQWLTQFHSRLCFVIGGAEGIPHSIKKRATQLISLSKMTLTHQMTRIVLLEQIYRALEIEKGSAYHK